MFSQFITFFKSGGALYVDIVVLLIVFIIFFFYSLYMGKNRIVSAILAFYPAVFLFKTFPFIDKLTILTDQRMLVLNKVAIFLIFFVPLNIIINRFVFAESGYRLDSRLLRVAGFALCGTALVLVFTYSVVNLDIFYDFSSKIDGLFTPESRIFWWSLAPLLLLAFL